MPGLHLMEATVGQRLADLRRKKARELGKKRITQGAVAEAIGVARQTVVYWENDQQVPEGENLAKLAAFYGTSPEFIRTGRLDGEPTMVAEAGPEYDALGSVTPPNYEGLGIEIPERDRLKPRPLELFDRFVHQLIDMGLGREDIEYWGRTVLAPIAHMNTLHRGQDVSDATTEEEQTWIVEGNVDNALRIIRNRQG